MNEQLEKRLHDALDACHAVARFIAGLDATEYLQSDLVRSAVERKLEIIGEALNQASHLEHKLEHLVPQFLQITAVCNQIIDGYDTVEDQIIWDLAVGRVPLLAGQLASLLES